MKKVWIALVVFFGLISFLPMCWAGPKAVFVEPVFEFDPLIEGQSVTHQFVVKNQGDTPLNIIKVSPP